MLKRSFDLFAAVIGLAVLALPMAMIALVVRLDSPGPALFWSQRVGADETIFWMPKFRTMKVGTPQLATHLLVDADDRLTGIGRFLRAWSLDELPQLFSVLRGQMSLVGPRPALFNQEDLIALRRDAGVAALRPGVTGWAQVNGRDELPIPVKVAFDREYALRQSLLLDIRIIFMTILRGSQGVSH
jgi:O-antigen biosynthesis protein WbqP